jgi:putative DNA primase/helicase
MPNDKVNASNGNSLEPRDAIEAALMAAKSAGGECFAAALDYRQRGWSALAVCTPNHVGVGPTHAKGCDSPGKAPWGPWKEYQTRLATEAELRRKWRDNPQLNVGMALGGVTGLIGLDVDEAGGEDLLRRLSGGDLPPTLEFTSGKGRRLLYRVPQGVELRPTPKPGGEAVENGELRLLGLGSQTVMPPSRHKDSGRRYAWVPGHAPGDLEPPVAPAWVVELMRADRANGKGRGPRAALGDGEKIPESQRNSTLASLAGSMRRRGMGYESIRAALMAENDERCEPPLAEAEVEKIATSIASYPPGTDGTARRFNRDRTQASEPESEPAPGGHGDQPGTKTFTLGTLTLAPGRPRQTASGKLTVPVTVRQGGAVTYQLVITNATSGRKEPARILAGLLGDGADPKEIDQTLTRVIGHAAACLENGPGAEGPTIREVVTGKVPEALRLKCRMPRGLWGETGGGREYTRADFVTFTPDWLLEEAGGAADAPRTFDGSPVRPELLRAVKVELEILWADLLSSLPTEADVDLGEDTEKGRAFRRAMVKLWKRTQTFEVVRDHAARNGEVAARASLASRVQRQAKPYLELNAPVQAREKWRPVQNAFDAWWRPWKDYDGRVRIVLAMRWTLADQAGVELPGARDEATLKALGKRFGVLIDPPPGVPAVLSGGARRLAVLSLELCRELLEEPVDDPEDNPRDPGQEV